MNVENFLNNFEHIANAPGGVLALRRIVYHFAFSGEIAEWSAENSASLAAQLAENLKTNGDGPSPVEGYHKIPPHWCWVKLSLIAHNWGQGKPSSTFTYIDVSAIDNKKGVIRDDLSVMSAESAPSRARKVVKRGTVIYSTVRPYLLNIAIIDKHYEPAPIASTAFAVLHPHEGVEGRFIYHYLHSPAFMAYVESMQIGVAYPAINDEKFFAAVFPLPPTKEQRRIAAKVDELMALCDRLETQQGERQKLFPTLSRSVHHHLVLEPSLANFNRLFHDLPRVSTDDLRRTTLSLAIEGKLVEQNPADEPASELLKRVRSGDKGNSRNTSLEGIPSIHTPKGWKVVTIAEVAVLVTDGDHQTPPQIRVPGILLLMARNIQKDRLNFLNVSYVEREIAEKSWERYKPKVGDVLMVSVGATIGRVAVVADAAEFVIVRSVAAIRPSKAILPEFLALSLRSQLLQKQIWSKVKQMGQPCIYLGKINSLFIALPPLAEQRRIVVKVAQLMALVSQLEGQTTEKQNVAEAFAKAAVASFTGTSFSSGENVKAPKTELISNLTLKKTPKTVDSAPLAALLAKNKKQMPAKSLWQQSGLSIDAFYIQLKTELAAGWIQRPDPKEAVARIVEEQA